MSDMHARDLMAPEPTHLPDDFASVREGLETGEDPATLAAAHPAASLAWAVLAEATLEGVDGELGSTRAVTAYAYARTGYHRGLDALRRAGWRGRGPVPVSHVPNQGFLRALLALAVAAEAIGENDEAARCVQFLVDSGTSVEAVRAVTG